MGVNPKNEEALQIIPCILKVIQVEILYMHQNDHLVHFRTRMNLLLRMQLL